MISIQDIEKFLKFKLNQRRRRIKIIALTDGMVQFFTTFFAVGCALVFLESMLWMPSEFRLAVCLFLIVAAGILFVRSIIYPAVSLFFRTGEPDDVEMARDTGYHIRHIKDRLANAIQVYEHRAEEKSGTSDELAAASLRHAYHTVRDIDFLDGIPVQHLVRRGRRGVLIVLIGFTAIFVFQNAFLTAMHRMMHPGQHFIRATPYSLTISPGSSRIVYGEDITLHVQIHGDGPEVVQLITRTGTGKQKTQLMRMPFRQQVSAVREEFEYFAKAGRVRSPVYTVTVIRRPMVRRMRLTITPPSYIVQKPRYLEANQGDVLALKGARVDVDVQADKTLSRAWIAFGSGTEKTLRISGRNAGAFFIVDKPDTYSIMLEDTTGLTNTRPIEYSIDVLKDLPPMARILQPAEDVDIDDSMVLPLTLEARDDYGFTGTWLRYYICEGGNAASVGDTMRFEISGYSHEVKRILKNINWNLAPVGMLPQDVIFYYYEVADNDDVYGPKMGRSRTYRARFPSMMEILQQMDHMQEQQIESLADLRDESETLFNELTQLSDEMKRHNELTWEERQKAGDLTESQKAVQEEIHRLNDDFGAMVQELEQHDLVPLKTMQKYMELQKLYDELASPELAEAMSKMQEMLEQMDPAAIQRAMEQVRFSQTDFLKSIERTISLLKRLQVEQKVSALARQIRETTSRQEALNRQVKESSITPEAGKEEQAGIREQIEHVGREMKETREMMSRLPHMPVVSMDKMMAHLEQSNLEQTTQDAEMAMASGKMDEASEKGEQAAESMQTLSAMMNQLEEELREGENSRVMEKLARSTERLLMLSESQEQLMQAISGGKRSPEQSARDQLAMADYLRQETDSLYQLSTETLVITPYIGRAIGEAQMNMQEAVKAMQQSESGMSYQRNAVGSLNISVMALMDAMENMAGGGGMAGLFGQLEKMSMAQMALNMKLQEMMGKGGLSLEQQASMARMAAEQKAIRERLERLIQQYGERPDITGRLDKMAEDMQRVVEELENRNATPETIRRQERILSRLLDAQKSLHERGFEKRRRAESGRDVIRQSPDGGIPASPEILDRIQRDLLRLGEEGYTEAYQALIRNYFEKLAEDLRKSDEQVR